jgi:glutathione S-transferase
MAPSQGLILYYYTFLPYARKISVYLALRGVPYTERQQPLTMPRPGLAAIGIKYHRTPVLSIGRNIYCDTAPILDKFEQLYPGSHTGGKTGYGQGAHQVAAEVDGSGRLSPELAKVFHRTS